MASVCAGFGVPHTPAFPSLLAAERGPWEEIRDCFAAVAAPLAAAELDALVVFSSDHFNTFFLDNMPTLAIGVAPGARGPNDGTANLPERVVPLHEDLARALFAGGVEAGFDFALCQELTLDHTFMVPLDLLHVPAELPIVPVFVNSFVAPVIAAERARRLGTALAAVVAAQPQDLRVGVLATGSFSLEVGGPRIEPGQPWGVPDPGWAARVVDLLGAGDLDRLVAEATPERIAGAGNAAAEVLDWIAMAAMVGAPKPSVFRAQLAFGHAYGVFPAEVAR